jgi:hypothetical protein
MPIKVSCSCGANFAAKDELAGKTVKCPKCQQPLAIPAGVAAARQTPKQPPAPQLAPPDPGVPSIFDEAGIKAKQHTGQVCPSCYHPMKPGTVLCVHCGYSLQLGRKLEMQVHGRGEGGHGEIATVALQRAANLIEEDKQEERKKTREGMPWWGYLLLFSAAVGLLTMMLLLPPALATSIALFFLVAGGGLLNFYGYVLILIVAFRDNVVQGLLIMFIPPYLLIYVIMKWDECGSLFLMMLGGWGIMIVAIVIMVAVSMGLTTKAASHLPTSRPEIILVRPA